MKKNTIISILVILGILVIDQILKIWVKTTFTYGQELNLIGERIKLLFVENNGMAFGMEIPGQWGKISLSLFRIFAITILIHYLIKIIRNGESTIFVVCISMIIAGATGNLIDSLFYGMIFSESTAFEVAKIFPAEGGYAPFLHGKVVDMFYCPIIKDSAGETLFFKPIFNVADSSITVSVFLMIIFYKKIFYKKKETSSSKDQENLDTAPEQNEIS
ncbi:MAG TPA: lipoprotein signal peptidase [Bacteroidales bacterium]|jgi:signal peptidase II|nr:lipoprotein signal peptidase [Bacteroidales bacterium]HOL98745.1 lipoprotein signal peptidase [Bacteroidales bacterium]HOM36186.1 lipoprotein signal peptidase [Bacteroidales bacterium]HPD23502.1 lipoprotein signal peptidase [Bacteroidales bacterium]HRS99634.1 lipoprotein signal peptidase [Bacteroidales bacterium]